MTSYLIRLHTDTSKPDVPSHRLAVIRWKSGKDRKTGAEKPKLTADRCVSIPSVKVTVTPEPLQKALQAAFEEMQDAVIRSFIEDQLEGKPAGSDLTDKQISEEFLTPEAVATYAAENQGGGKLSKAKIEEWFSSNLKANLELALVEKLGETITDEQLASTLENYKVGLLKLSSPQANFSEKNATQLKRAIELATSDAITDRLLKKVSGFLKPKEETILDVL